MTRKILKTALIIAVTAAITTVATSIFMIYTAKPDIPCNISWLGFVQSYK